MRRLYIDCSVGVAGDMLTASLLDHFDNKEGVIKELNDLGLPNVEYECHEKSSCGIMGFKVDVFVNGREEGSHHEDGGSGHDHPDDVHHDDHHSHHSLADVKAAINATVAPDTVKGNAYEVYELIAQAESKVHGTTVSNIHFHEVGTMDAIADVLAVSYLIDKLKLDSISASPINVGSGTVKCAHGVLPVPAPATALLLEDIPNYGSDIPCELCTPTGAALIKHFASSFGPQPCISTESVGYGFGTREFDRPNCVRSILGHSIVNADQIVELSCNIDDMTGEEVGFACSELLDMGALDVFTSSIQMKKFRPGTLLRVICEPSRSDEFATAIMRLTSTLGIRKKECSRYIKERCVDTTATEFGEVRLKKSTGFGCNSKKIEYDDLAKIAHELGVSLNEAQNIVRKGMQE